MCIYTFQSMKTWNIIIIASDRAVYQVILPLMLEVLAVLAVAVLGGGSTTDGQDTIRMPPSLTVSKIRSLKEQALVAAIHAKLEISTVATIAVWFVGWFLIYHW